MAKDEEEAVDFSCFLQRPDEQSEVFRPVVDLHNQHQSRLPWEPIRVVNTLPVIGIEHGLGQLCERAQVKLRHGTGARALINLNDGVSRNLIFWGESKSRLWNTTAFVHLIARAVIVNVVRDAVSSCGEAVYGRTSREAVMPPSWLRKSGPVGLLLLKLLDHFFQITQTACQGHSQALDPPVPLQLGFLRSCTRPLESYEAATGSARQPEASVEGYPAAAHTGKVPALTLAPPPFDDITNTFTPCFIALRNEFKRYCDGKTDELIVLKATTVKLSPVWVRHSWFSSEKTGIQLLASRAYGDQPDTAYDNKPGLLYTMEHIQKSLGRQLEGREVLNGALCWESLRGGMARFYMSVLKYEGK
ncbi:hypothetical protein FQN60_015979, partial [Etheostoma spectabile]